MAVSRDLHADQGLKGLSVDTVITVTHHGSIYVFGDN